MKKWLVLALAGSMALSACSGSGTEDSGPSQESIPTVLGPGEKADDFRSESAQEYFVRGTTNIVLDSEWADNSEAAKLQRVKELIPYKQVVIGYFLNTYLIDKSSHNSNEDYGGLKALTKNGSYEDLGIQKVDELTYSFEFVQEVGGQFDLIDELAQEADAQPNADGSWTFQLAVGEVSNDEMTDLEHGSEWYRGYPWSGFSPDSVSESRWYWQELRIEEQERSSDAWLDYKRLFADGAVDIAVFYGWDYHGSYHQRHSESTYEWLTRWGFTSPVDNWADYATNRAPLTKTISTPDGPVDVNVTLWWGEPGTVTDPDTDAGGIALENAMRESLETNEVTMFSGHSGAWYGFALANWRRTSEGDLDDSEIPGLDLPSDKYQIVVAEGCDTYALGEAFWQNPNKSDRKSLDIVTTTSFSRATTNATVHDMIAAVIRWDGDGNHNPLRWAQLLEEMDRNTSWFQTMYGVHGIDDNPHKHPYANDNALCMSCSSSSDCGPNGNICANLEGSNVCTFECTADDGCPDGFSCQETQVDGWLDRKVCVPTSFTCDTIPEEDEGGVTITELLADPASGLDGDANGDGTRSARGDEFIELHNSSSQSVELSGWTISDAVSTRFTFPGGAAIEPGGYLVVFGGGDAADFTGLPDVPVFTADGLFLNNGGDSLTLADGDGEPVDAVSYGGEGGDNRPLVRNGEGLEVVDTYTPGAAN